MFAARIKRPVKGRTGRPDSTSCTPATLLIGPGRSGMLDGAATGRPPSHEPGTDAGVGYDTPFCISAIEYLGTWACGFLRSSERPAAVVKYGSAAPLPPTENTSPHPRVLARCRSWSPNTKPCPVASPPSAIGIGLRPRRISLVASAGITLAPCGSLTYSGPSSPTRARVSRKPLPPRAYSMSYSSS